MAIIWGVVCAISSVPFGYVALTLRGICFSRQLLDIWVMEKSPWYLKNYWTHDYVILTLRWGLNAHTRWQLACKLHTIILRRADFWKCNSKRCWFYKNVENYQHWCRTILKTFRCRMKMFLSRSLNLLYIRMSELYFVPLSKKSWECPPKGSMTWNKAPELWKINQFTQKMTEPSVACNVFTCC